MLFQQSASDPQARRRLFEDHLQPLIQRHAAGLMTTLFGLAVEDLVQEVALVVWRQLPEFEYRGEKALHRWIRTIVRSERRAALDYWSAGKRSAHRSQGLTGEEASTSSPEHEVRERELQVRLLIRIGLLPPPKDELTRRVLLEDETIAEVARDLGLPHSTARNQYHQSLAKLAYECREFLA